MKLARVLVVALTTLCCVPFFGASSGLPPPIVVVYPLSASGGADPEAGASIAVALAQRLATSGGLVVKPYPPGTQRVDYLTAAQKLNADYYISGFLTPLGDQISMVTQVVSVSSGTVIFSNSAFVKTYGDAAAQAEGLQLAILRHAGRALAILDAPPRETPVPTAAPKGESNFLGLFKKKQKPEPTAQPSTAPSGAATSAPRVASRSTVAPAKPPAAAPTRKPEARPTPAPRAVPTPRPTPLPTDKAVALAPAPLPSRTPRPNSSTLARLRLAASILVLNVAGDADATLAGYAQDSMVTAIGRGGTTVAGLPADPADLPARAREFCGLAFGSKTLYAPTLTFDNDRDGHPTDVELDVVSYDCSGIVTGRQHSRSHIGSRGLQTAVDHATADAVGAFAFANQGK